MDRAGWGQRSEKEWVAQSSSGDRREQPDLRLTGACVGGTGSGQRSQMNTDPVGWCQERVQGLGGRVG